MGLPSQDNKVGPGAYFTLAFAAVFFSGLLGGKEWYGVFDFTTLNGAVGVLSTVIFPVVCWDKFPAASFVCTV